jgi:hypothetical protein
MSKSLKNYQEPTREEISACAYRIYEREGRPNGKATQHWLEAEAQLIAERKAQAGELPAKAQLQIAPGSGPAKGKASDLAWTAPSRSRQNVHAN